MSLGASSPVAHKILLVWYCWGYGATSPEVHDLHFLEVESLSLEFGSTSPVARNRNFLVVDLVLAQPLQQLAEGSQFLPNVELN